MPSHYSLAKQKVIPHCGMAFCHYYYRMDTFDYIIVGAGSAGCVLAHRLTESGQHTVLLLEAGGQDTHPNISVPAAFHKNFKTSRDWDLDTIPQPGLDNRQLYKPRGKVLGGSSSINAMLYVRGHRADYDGWAALGNKGWSYEEVLPYFKKSEDQRDIHDEYHGQGGPLPVGNSQHYHPLSHSFIEAGEELGYSANNDINGARQEGFGLLQSTTLRGGRASTARSFLRAARQHRGLQIATQAQVLRVDIADDRATGVTYRQNGKTIQAKANREVILSAGAFHSPHILLHSGIGDGKLLQRYGIAVHKNLPGVGENLQDHLVYPVCFLARAGSTIDTAEQFPQVVGHLLHYLLQRKGPLASTIAEASAFCKSDPTLSAPDLQFHFGPALFINHGFTRPKGLSGYSIGPTLLTPASRGQVSLANADPLAAPLIDPRYLSEETDLQRLITGGRLAQQLGMTDAFASVRTGFYQPGQQLQTDAEWSDYIRQNAQIIYHPVGTCRMGQDALAVVDHQLRVHGIRALRVVDASVMPTVPRGNTNAPTIMIAERAADFILQK